MNLPNEIQEAIQKKRLVVFAGSGLSMKFELPSWKKLTEDVIRDINDDNFNDLLPVLKSGILTPIEVLDKIQGEHTKIRSYIKQNFKIDNSHDFSLHKKIIDLTQSVITTNYDNAFEQASLNKINVTKFTSNFNISEISKSEDPYIFKLHGCYSEPDNCILFSEDYKKLYDGDSASKEKLKAIFTNYTIIFVGFSFNDPDINLIFSNLDKLFENNNRHFILTHDTQSFEKFNFLKSVKINDYSIDIDKFFDTCINFKKLHIKPVTDIPNEVNRLPRIAFLKPKPLDITIDTELIGIENCFDDLDADLFSGYLNTRTLESIDDYDILIVVTKVFKEKLYIEDENLKANLLTTEEICSHIPNDKIPIIFITNHKIELASNYNTINIFTFKRATLKRFVFKALRNNQFDFNLNDEITLGLSTFNTLKYERGLLKKSSIYPNNRPLDIGEKSLKNIIGRIEEQSNIISKLHSINKSNKVLNIKASGGTGKTTLIKKVSYELYNRGYYKDGVSFKSCESVKSYEDFEDIFYDAFNLGNIINFKEYIYENYSSRKLDSLIILDNFESVSNSLDQSDFEQVINLIKFATDFANIVITSRERVPDLEDFEDLYSLVPLTTDDAFSLFEVNYGKIKSDDQIRILRQDILEELLNNNPLAIKLVTKSRTRFIHISELRDQIKNQFFESLNEDFTSVFKNKVDLNIERTKSIYQSINYSYTTLTPKEKIAFELLSLFPDGIDLGNFKKCFEKSTSSNSVSDKELRTLRDKSLVEDYNGTLQLQPIIRRFAEYHFSKRQDEPKQKYCLDAYIFNCHLLDIIELIKDKKNTSEALKVYNYFKNNLLNVFSYIPDIQINATGPVSEKKYLLNYIYDIGQFVLNEKQINEFNTKINSIKSYFSDLPHSETLIKVLKLQKRYFFEEFEESYRELSKLFPPTEIELREMDNEEQIERRYKNVISNIHSMEGFTINKIESHIINNDLSLYLDSNLFYLGIPNTISRRKQGFYFFEYELMFNQLNSNQLEDYIGNLHVEQHLEAMQSTYTLSKVKVINKKTINKLVVTNPYTKGLKDLMNAFISNSSEEKILLFESALKNLVHIKYYYLEALYFYCQYLKDLNNEQYSLYIIQGLELSKKYYYQYIHHLFSCLNIGSNNSYNFSYSFYPNSKIEQFVCQHNEKWEQIFLKADAN